MEGVNLVLPYFDWPDSSEEMIKEFEQRSTSFSALHVDLTDKAAVTKMMTHINGKFNGLNYLVNNIERGGMPVVHGSYNHDHNCDQWELELKTILKAKSQLFNHCFPILLKADSAAFVDLSSISAITGRSGPAELLFSDGYSTANKGISSFTNTWVREGAPKIRVNKN